MTTRAPADEISALSVPSERDAPADTFDISEEALGNNLPRNYYRSVQFLGTVLVAAQDVTVAACLLICDKVVQSWI